MVAALLERAGIKGEKYTACTDDPTYHPGRCADVSVGDKYIGRFGEIHPDVLDTYGIDSPAYIADLSLDSLFELAHTDKEYHPLPKYPAAVRDLAFVCDDELEVGTIEEVIAKADRKTIESVTLFDVYRGPQVGEGKKSVAFNITMRSADHTLTVEEADKTLKKVLTLLERELGLTLRK